MSSCSLPLVLLVLICVQSFTLAKESKTPSSCCFVFQKRKIPVQLITKYEETERACYHPGIVFIMKNGRRLCANPRVQWVKEHMDKIDQRVHKTSN
ncbi:C-C motif chemokine 4 homolog [Clarias gariepinus]|uniref:C-C motif chemokine 4 homolog n=1 Tax=Clarias gariepinus TaxID=13013 RepID=UPI00234D713B|nr:C-C motif chemokine 4 homolog [Clarias gariepinus]